MGNDMKLIMEDWRRYLSEQSSNEPTVSDFIKLYAKQKPKTLQKALGTTAKLTAGIAAGLLVGKVAAATVAGLGIGAGAAGATAAAGAVASGAGASAAAKAGADATEQAIAMIYDKIAERSGEMAKGLMGYLSTPDDSNDPLAKFFDIEDEYVKLLQGLDSELGQKFRKELLEYYERVFAQIDEQADGQRPLSDFLKATANQYFKRFLFKRRMSGVGVNVSPS